MIKHIDYIIPEGRMPIDTVFDYAERKGTLPKLFSTRGDGVSFFRDVLSLRETASEPALYLEKI
jgi:hypothetical protein